jgi:hypothetical protein
MSRVEVEDIPGIPGNRKAEQSKKQAEIKRRQDRRKKQQQSINYVPESVNDVSGLEYVEENSKGSWYNNS